MTPESEEIEKAYDIITYKYSEDDIYRMVDETVSDFVDEGWDEDERDTYIETEKNEAKQYVIEEIIRECLNENDIDLDTDQEIELTEMLQDEYNINVI